MTTQLIQDLKSCPFCGNSNPHWLTTDGWFYISCNGCSAGTGRHRTKEDAVNAWNKRPTSEVEAVTAELDRAQVGTQQLDYLISKFASVVATLVDDPEAYDVLATLKNALEVLNNEYYILWSNAQMGNDNDLWKPVESEDFRQFRIKREAEQSRLKAWQEMATEVTQ